MGSQSAGIGSALPDQTGFSGYILTTDGVTASWEASSASLPTQVGQSGKYLTTNGTVASWGTITADSLLPSQTGKNGDVLGTNGTTVAWVSASGITLAAFSSTPSNDGLTLTGSALNLDPADLTHPGGVSTAAQTFAGVKTFDSVPVAAGISAPTTSGFTLAGNVTTGGSAIGVVVDNLVALTTAGAKIISFQNHEAEKASIDKDGTIVAGGPVISSGAVTTSGSMTAQLGTAFGGAYGMFSIGNGGGAGFVVGSDGSKTVVSAPAGNVEFQRAFGGALVSISTTQLDCTGLGTGGAILLKDANGTTRTVTISGAGAWVIT